MRLVKRRNIYVAVLWPFRRNQHGLKVRGEFQFAARCLLPHPFLFKPFVLKGDD